MKTFFKTKKLSDVLLYISVAILIFASGYKFSEWKIKNGSIERSQYTIFNSQPPVKNDNTNANVDFGLFWETWNILEKKYVFQDKLNTKNMVYGAIKGMVSSIGDPYTFFLTPDENKQAKDDLNGKFEGIGAQLGLKEGRIVVIAPLKDSPAQGAGVRAGDIIDKVDGKSTSGWTLMQAVSKIRGPKNTKVILTMLRADNREVEIPITRQTIKVDSIEMKYVKATKGQLAYIKINQFGDSTNQEWDTAISDILPKYENGAVTGLVLDLRNNPGGYLESAVYIASEFLEKGMIVVKQEATTADNHIFISERSGNLIDIPLVILINSGSASASEILAGALRDHNKATLIGEKSFGKGSIQNPMDLEGGAGLHVTIAKWILPNGDWIHGKGIEPSIKIENTPLKEGEDDTKKTDNQLDKAIEFLNQKR